MAGNPTHLEHLLRRAGFGAGAAELAALEGKSTFEALAYVLDVEDQPDDVDSKIGQPDHISVSTARGPFSPEHQHRGRAPALAVPDGPLAAAARRRRWRSSGTTTSPPPTARWPARSAPAGHQDDGPQGAASCPVRRARSSSFASRGSAASAICWWRWRRTRRCSSGSTGARTRGSGRRRTSAARSWSSSRSASATTPRRTSTPRRACSPGGTCASWATCSTRRATTSSPTSPNNHDPTAKTFTFPIYRRRQHHDSRPRGERRHAGRHRLHQRAGHASGHGRTPRAQVVELLRQRGDSARPRVPARRRRRLPDERHAHQAARAVHAAVALVPESRQLARPLRVAGGVRGARGRRKSGSSASRWTACARRSWPWGRRSSSRPT